MLADDQAAGALREAGAKAAGKLVVFSPAAAPAGGWVGLSLTEPIQTRLASALRTGGARVWVQVPALKSPGKPSAPSAAPAAGEPAQTLAVAPGLPQFAGRMARLGTETAFDVLAQVHALRAEGRNIVSFGLGEPDFDTPGHIKDAAKKALDANETHYGPSQGLLKLREECARYIRQTRHIDVTADHVAIGPGAKPIIFDAMMR